MCSGSRWAGLLPAYQAAGLLEEVGIAGGVFETFQEFRKRQTQSGFQLLRALLQRTLGTECRLRCKSKDEDIAAFLCGQADDALLENFGEALQVDIEIGIAAP